ncbi:MAG: hypothetical protein ABEJ59_03200 [Halanaeroarchaeum sp.]
MTDRSVQLPDGWRGRNEGAAAYACERPVDDQRRVVLEVTPETAHERVQLRAAAVDEGATLTEQEFLVGEYETVEAALDALAAFAETVSEMAVGTGEHPIAVDLREAVETFQDRQAGWFAD